METAIAIRPSGAAPAVASADDVAAFLNRFRESVGLPPKPRYESNFLFDSPSLECVHVLRIAFDDIFLELETAGERRPDGTGTLVGA